MGLRNELGYPSIYLEVGPDSRYWRLPGEALVVSYQRNDVELEAMAVRLAQLIETITYANDRFDILVAPLADEIERRLSDYRPFGKVVEIRTISKYVEIRLYRSDDGWWMRLVSDLRAPYTAFNEKREKKSEQILDAASNLKGLKKTEVAITKMNRQDFGSTYYYLDLSGRIVVKESSWVHDFGEEIRFSKSYFFANEEQAKDVWEKLA